MNASPAEILADIINTRESENGDRWKQEAVIARYRAESLERLKKTLADEANRRLEMDLYLREKFKEAGVENRWVMFRMITEFEDLVRERYKLTAEEIKSFSGDLDDLIAAKVAGLDILELGFDIDHQNTARIILRVIYADDWKKFVDEFWVRMDVPALIN